MLPIRATIQQRGDTIRATTTTRRAHVTNFRALLPITSSRGRVLHEIHARALVSPPTQTAPAKDLSAPRMHADFYAAGAIEVQRTQVRNE